MEQAQKYLQILFDGSEGYVYAPVKNSDGSFTKEFFAWPAEQDALLAKIEAFKDRGDLYVGPALYREPGRARKDNILHSNTVWVEFDGNYDQCVWTDVPRPTLEILSSKVGRVHCYWRMENPLQVEAIERITRGLSYSLHSDASGWDATQILRPPGTLNSKYGLRTSLLISRRGEFGAEDFAASAWQNSVVLSPEITGVYPDVKTVLSKYSLPEKGQKLLDAGPKLDCDKWCPQTCSGSHRSEGLMQLGYILAEIGMEPNEMMSVLLDADTRFQKFTGRDDQAQRIMDIVIRAKEKHPDGVQVLDPIPTMSIMNLMAADIKVDWIWEGFLQVQGLLMLSGAPGIGKSQFALDVAAHIATGTPYLDWKTRQCRVGFLSLEMGPIQLKNILENQMKNWTAEKRKQLDEHLLLYPHGESIYLDNEDNQKEVEKLIKRDRLNVLIIDSLAATSPEEFSSEKVAKGVLDWIAHVKKKYNCAIWLIHHNRKATSENKKPNSISDVHGAVAIAARMDTVIILWKDKQRIMFLPRKTRMSDEDQREHEITRGKTLTFSIARPSNGLKPEGPVESVETETAPTAPGFKFSMGHNNAG